jgi:glutamine amidotransferase
MTELQRLELDAVVCEIGTHGKPLLGICLGMQMLLDESEEFGKRVGLGLIPGQVIPLPTTTIDGEMQKIPHIGWNSLEVASGAKSWDDTILRGLNRGEAVYFVHSYMADVKDTGHGVADCIYGGNRVAAVIARDNVIGCQFHPEKSGEVGLKVLRQFLSL